MESLNRDYGVLVTEEFCYQKINEKKSKEKPKEGIEARRKEKRVIEAAIATANSSKVEKYSTKGTVRSVAFVQRTSPCLLLPQRTFSNHMAQKPSSPSPLSHC